MNTGAFCSWVAASAYRHPGQRSPQVRRPGCRVENEPLTASQRSAEDAFRYASIYEGLLLVVFDDYAEPPRLPLNNKALDIPVVHGAIAKKVLVVPDSPPNNQLMIAQALVPTARVFCSNLGDRHDEIDEFKLDGHG